MKNRENKNLRVFLKKIYKLIFFNNIILKKNYLKKNSLNLFLNKRLISKIYNFIKKNYY